MSFGAHRLRVVFRRAVSVLRRREILEAGNVTLGALSFNPLACRHKVDGFGDVGCMVAHTFDVLRDEKQMRTR